MKKINRLVNKKSELEISKDEEQRMDFVSNTLIDLIISNPKKYLINNDEHSKKKQGP